MRSGALKLNAVYWISRSLLPGGSSSARVALHDRVPVRRCSTTTGGGTELGVRRDGSTIASPRIVANQSFPSLLFQPAGCVPPLHSAVRSPSPVPYTVDSTLLRTPRATSSSARLL